MILCQSGMNWICLVSSRSKREVQCLDVSQLSDSCVPLTTHVFFTSPDTHTISGGHRLFVLSSYHLTEVPTSTTVLGLGFQHGNLGRQTHQTLQEALNSSQQDEWRKEASRCKANSKLPGKEGNVSGNAPISTTFFFFLSPFSS